MQTIKTTATLASRSKTLCYAAMATVLLALSHQAQAQNNSSYNANTIPVNGMNNCAFGISALLTTTTQSYDNVAAGYRAMQANQRGSYNCAIGSLAMTSNINANYCSAIGYTALQYNTSGEANTACGAYSLTSNRTASFNTGTGAYTLYSNSGNYNTANGFLSLYLNEPGSYNSTNGAKTLENNISGSNNTAAGYNAMNTNTTGDANTASGSNALFSNIGGNENTAIGSNALYSNTNGNRNIAAGQNALYSNTTGVYSVAVGGNALRANSTGSQNTAIGNAALFNSTGGFNTGCGGATLMNNTSGASNTALGNAADVSAGTLSYATALGSNAIVNSNDKVRIGSTTVTAIEGQVAYTWPSDGRFKENITEDVKGLAFIQLLRPVVYNFNTRKFEEFLTKNMTVEQQATHLEGRDFAPSTAIRQSGFIAQEVEQAAKKANYDFNGIHVPKNDDDNYSLAYAEFVVPLVKGMQEQQKMIEDQKKMIEQLQQQVASLQKNMGTATTGMDHNLLSGLSVDQNVPNPFSHETVIACTIPANVGNAYITVCDLTGKQIKMVPINQRGASSVTLTSELLADGMYIYSVIADGKVVDTKRMIVSRQ